MNLKTKQTKIRQNHNAIKLMWFLLFFCDYFLDAVGLFKYLVWKFH